MTVSIPKCDICGKLKGEANKWLKAAIDRDGRGLYVFAHRPGEDAQGLDLCSDTCLQKKLSEVLAAIRTEPEQIAVVCKHEEANA